LFIFDAIRGIVVVGGLVEVFPNNSATDGSPCERNTNKLGCKDIVMGVTFSYVEAYERIFGTSSAPATALPEGVLQKNRMNSLQKTDIDYPPHFSVERARALLR
jgi:hypothetical protein